MRAAYYPCTPNMRCEERTCIPPFREVDARLLTCMEERFLTFIHVRNLPFLAWPYAPHNDLAPVPYELVYRIAWFQLSRRMHHYNVALLYEEPLFLQSLTTALQGRGHSLFASVPNTAALKLALAMRPGVQLALFSVASATANNYDLLPWSVVQLPTTRILLLGREPEDPALAAAFFAGASGYYCTRDPEDTLMHTCCMLQKVRWYSPRHMATSANTPTTTTAIPQAGSCAEAPQPRAMRIPTTGGRSEQLHLPGHCQAHGPQPMGRTKIPAPPLQTLQH